MKTVSEHEAELKQKREARDAEYARRREAIQAKFLPLEELHIDKRAWVGKMREQFLLDRYKLSALACDDCAVELVDDGSVNLSCPPTKWHTCLACGRRYLAQV